MAGSGEVGGWEQDVHQEASLVLGPAFGHPVLCTGCGLASLATPLASYNVVTSCLHLSLPVGVLSLPVGVPSLPVSGTGVLCPRKLNCTESPQKTRASDGNCSCFRYPSHCHTRTVGDPVRKTTSDS